MAWRIFPRKSLLQSGILFESLEVIHKPRSHAPHEHCPKKKWEKNEACISRSSLYDSFYWNYYTPKSTESRNSDFSVSRGTNSNVKFWFNLDVYRRIWVSGFGGFGGCSIFGGNCHTLLSKSVRTRDLDLSICISTYVYIYILMNEYRHSRAT